MVHPESGPWHGTDGTEAAPQAAAQGWKAAHRRCRRGITAGEGVGRRPNNGNARLRIKRRRLDWQQGWQRSRGGKRGRTTKAMTRRSAGGSSPRPMQPANAWDGCTTPWTSLQKATTWEDYKEFFEFVLMRWGGGVVVGQRVLPRPCKGVLLRKKVRLQEAVEQQCYPRPA